MMQNDQVKAIALQYAGEGFKDSSVREALMVSDYVCHFCGTPEIRGREAVNEFNEATLHTGFPDVQQIVEDIIVDGSKAALRITYQGTHLGEFLGIPPTGKRIDVSANMILRIVDGKVVEEWTESNPLTWMKQIEALGWLQLLM